MVIPAKLASAKGIAVFFPHLFFAHYWSSFGLVLFQSASYIALYYIVLIEVNFSSYYNYLFIYLFVCLLICFLSFV